LPRGRNEFTYAPPFLSLYVLLCRRMSCNADVNILTRLFENQAEDSEVRIASFIGLMRCPTYLTISSIKAALEREEVNQGELPQFTTYLSPIVMTLINRAAGPELFIVCSTTALFLVYV